MRYRRTRIKGGTYFFTLVTFKREKILTRPENLLVLRHAFIDVRRQHPFEIDAIVLLPDHLHCVWTLPDDDHDFSTRWRLIKSHFTRNCDDKFKPKPFGSRAEKKEQALWQRRFWEHLIRDEEDYLRHVEYVHYNPVKHGLVSTPGDWQYSSFHRYVEMGKYRHDWASSGNITFHGAIAGE